MMVAQSLNFHAESQLQQQLGVISLDLNANILPHPL